MRALALAASGTVVAWSLLGCSGAGDTVDAAKSAARSAAAAEVKDQVQSQICDLVKDEKLSADERAKLSSLLDKAQQLNLPDDILGPLQDLTEKGASAKQDLADLRERCATRT
jgi:hypothetical protein